MRLAPRLAQLMYGCCTLAISAATTQAQAQPAGDPTQMAIASPSTEAIGMSDGLPDGVHSPLKVLLDRETSGVKARVEIRIGQLDSRLKLAPCNRIEPFVPTGARLWGKTQVGLRCTDGARWQVYLPVEVHAYGPVLHLQKPIAAGMPISADDVKAEEVDLTRIGPDALTSTDTLEGKVATRPLMSQQALLAQHLRGATVLSAGESVRVVIHSPSFTVTADGTAISPASEGQQVRVRIASGRVITGVARKDGLVEVRL